MIRSTMRPSRPRATPLRAAPLCLALLAAALLPACSSLPTSGPSNSEVVDNITGPDNPLGAKLVDLTPAAV